MLHSGEQQRRITQSLSFASHSLCTGNFVTSLHIIYDILMIHYFIVYLMTLFTKTKHCQILRWLVNNELERMLRETVIIKFDILYWKFPENTEEEHEKSYSAQSVPCRNLRKSEVSSFHSVFFFN